VTTIYPKRGHESSKIAGPAEQPEPRRGRSNLRIVAGAKAPAERVIRAGGIAPPADMPFGQYVGLCEGAKAATMWGKPTAVITCRVIEGKYSGVALKGFFEIDLNGETAAAGCEYYKICEIALDREIEPGEDLRPSQVFTGKIFVIQARFRLAAPGKRRHAEDPTGK
jgi:hypothetical protein